MNNDASFNALSISLGSCGASDETPSTTLNCPADVKNSVPLFGR